jgi:hypothetical protein
MPTKYTRRRFVRTGSALGAGKRPIQAQEDEERFMYLQLLSPDRADRARCRPHA